MANYARRYDLGTPSGGGIWSLNLSDPGAWIAQDLGTSVNAGSTLSLTFSTLREDIYKSPNGGQGKLDVSLLVGAATYTQRFDLSGDTKDTWITKTFSQQIATTGNLTIKFAHVDIAGVGDRITTWNTNNGPGDIGRVQIDAVSNVSVSSSGGGGTPTITGGTLSGALSSTYGTASSPATFTLAGANMTAGILVTAPSGLEVSQASGSGYATTTTVGSAGTIATTTVYVRLAATAAVGSYNSQNIVLSSSGATPVDVATTSSGNIVVTTFANLIGGYFPSVTDALIVGRNADPDKDGHPNFLEFALNASPGSSSSSGRRRSVLRGREGRRCPDPRRRPTMCRCPPALSSTTSTSSWTS